MLPPRYGFIPISPLASPALLGLLAVRSLLTRPLAATFLACLIVAGVVVQGLLGTRGWVWRHVPPLAVALPVAALLSLHMRTRARNVALLSMLGFSGFDLYLAVSLQGCVLAAAGLLTGGLVLMLLHLVLTGANAPALWRGELFPHPVWPWFVALGLASAPAALQSAQQDPAGLLADPDEPGDFGVYGDPGSSGIYDDPSRSAARLKPPGLQ